MGQKVNPIAFRIGVRGCKKWRSRWFARDQYADKLKEDLSVREHIARTLPKAEIGEVEIEMAGDAARVIIHSARAGVVIGKKGQEIDALRKSLARLLKKQSVDVSVQEIKEPALSAQVVALNIADQLERRMSYKKVAKKAAADTMRAGAKGVKIRIAGRLDGAEIARDEWIRVGSTPLHTLRSDIDYGTAEAEITVGKIGVKVWICRGEYKSNQGEKSSQSANT